MRFRIASLLCLGMLASFAYADQPTKTIAQGGWFAIGGPSQIADMLCGGPCSDQAFANAYGSMLSNIPVMNADLHETRGKAINALTNGDFSIGGEVCLPSDSGLSGALVSGFVRYYTLSDFTYEQLVQASPGLPSLNNRIDEITQAIDTWLVSLGLANLSGLSPGALLNPIDGQSVQPFLYEAAFTDLDLQEHAAITRWANIHSAVVNGVNVSNLQTSNLTCP